MQECVGRLLPAAAGVRAMTANGRALPPAVANLLARLDVPLVGKLFDIDALAAAVGKAARRLGSMDGQPQPA